MVVGKGGTAEEFRCSRQAKVDRRRGCPRVDVLAQSRHWACLIDVVASPRRAATATRVTSPLALASLRARFGARIDGTNRGLRSTTALAPSCCTNAYRTCRR
jgi:hypothetical protein